MSNFYCTDYECVLELSTYVLASATSVLCTHLIFKLLCQLWNTWLSKYSVQRKI